MATGWGNKTWGASDWGDLSDETVVASSIVAQTSISSVTTEANADVEPTTLSATFTLQGVVAGASADVSLTGIGFNIVTGNEGIGIGVPVTGSSASTNITGVTIDDQYLIGAGWGRETWGSFAWGDNYSVLLQGISLSAVTGNEDAFTDVVVAVSGIDLSTDITPVGTSATSDNEIAHSFLIQTTLEDVSIVGTGLVELTGITLSTAISEVEAGTIQEVPVTGVSATLSIGNEDQSGTAVVSVTGIESTLTLGDAVAESKYEVTGISASFTLGELSITGSAFVIPNGIGLTANTITPNIIAWAEVDVGTPVTWSPVDLAA
jgi:hypothetical protein